MLVGIFGLPGGAEWLIIFGVVVLLFVPSLALFGLGYVVGRGSAATPDPPATPAPQEHGNATDGDRDA